MAVAALASPLAGQGLGRSWPLPAFDPFWDVSTIGDLDADADTLFKYAIAHLDEMQWHSHTVGSITCDDVYSNTMNGLGMATWQMGTNWTRGQAAETFSNDVVLWDTWYFDRILPY